VRQRRRRMGWLRPRTIRGRAVQLLVLPLAIVVVLLSVMVAGQFRGYRAAGDTAGAVRLSLAVQDLVHELQRERGLTLGLLGGASGFRGELAAQRGRVDAARQALDRLVGTADPRDAVRVRTALAGLSELANRRADVDAGQGARREMFDFYTGVIGRLNGLDLGLDRVQDPVLRTGLEALAALGQVKENTAQERGLVNGAAAAGRFGTPEYQQFLAIRAARLAALDQFARYATAAQRRLLADAQESSTGRTAADLEQRAVTAGDELLHIDPATWWTAMTGFIDQLRAVQQSIGADITTRAAGLRRNAARDLAALLAAAVAAFAVVAGVAVSAARAITGPLRVRAREADDLAHRRLPAAVARAGETGAEIPGHPRGGDDAVLASPAPPRVPPQATAEVRQVALALAHLQTAAFTLAVEQAATRRTTTDALAHLGRRNEDLLRRQLGLISMLEAQEPDPTALGHLFELDHLATRMRRNAESLLILAGESNPRRWTMSLPVADVIRGAVGEVEEYPRVALRRIEAGHLAGHVVADLAHMLAELVENGLTFSHTTTEVAVSGRHTAKGYEITVVDRGVGMDADQLARANARLAGREHFLSTPGRFVGHYVVGRLAAALAVDVQLESAPMAGTTARLSLPPSLLAAAALSVEATTASATTTLSTPG